MSPVLRIMFLVVCHFSMMGQQVGFVSNFRLAETSRGVLLSWDIDKGNVCQGVDILHSTDGVSFSEAGHIFGVCGSLDKVSSYDFLHESPDGNETNYYQLKINGYGYTEVLSIYWLELGENGALVYPNPVVDHHHEVTLKLYNPNQELRMIRVIDAKGNEIYQKVSTAASAQIPTDGWLKGMYSIMVLNEQQRSLSTTKLVVL